MQKTMLLELAVSQRQGPEGYQGDVTPQQAFEYLTTDHNALLVDVRTAPEWGFVGEPVLENRDQQERISWKSFPTFEVNTNFIDQLKLSASNQDTPIFFLCKTGGRSMDAAIAATQAGYKSCINVMHGFEGDANDQSQRGYTNGWKAAQLPWRQQ